MTNIVTIGSATMDVFVECEDANIVSVRTKNKKSECVKCERNGNGWDPILQ